MKNKIEVPAWKLAHEVRNERIDPLTLSHRDLRRILRHYGLEISSDKTKMAINLVTHFAVLDGANL